MAIWCTTAEVEDLMSVDGANTATDDNGDNVVLDPNIMANAIERGQSILSTYLVAKYDISTITSANTYIKWATAAFAAVELMRRKGGVVPAGLQEIIEEYKLTLSSMQNGTGQIPGLNLRASPGITVTNVTMDNRYRRAKVRVVETISFPVGVSTLPRFRDPNDYGNIS